MIYDERRGAYMYCRFCHGAGCLVCPQEARKAYKREFPNDPQPIATFDVSKPEDMDRARKALGREAVEKAFGPGGGGMREIIENLKRSQPSRADSQGGEE